MGKIRIKTLGDEAQEKKDQKKAQARAEAKKAAEVAAAKALSSEDPGSETSRTAAAKKEAESENSEEVKQNKKVEATNVASSEDLEQSRKTKKKEKFAKEKKQKHSTSYIALAEKVDKNKVYKLADALAILPTLKRAKFDETVELHINTTDKGVSGAVTLPHGTGKQVRVAIAAGSDEKHVEALVKKIESGQIDFDVLIATPDAMPKLARVARVLGPRGLMPNPKNGTVSPKPEEVAKKFEGGQMNFKTEAKFPLMHLSVGKVSFGDKKLSENIKAAVAAVTLKKIKTVTLKSTMSPGLKVDTTSLSA